MSTPAEDFADVMRTTLGTPDPTPTPEAEPVSRLPRPNLAQGTSGGVPNVDPADAFVDFLLAKFGNVDRDANPSGRHAAAAGTRAGWTSA